MILRKLLPQQKTMDPDAFVDAMNRDLAQCCKRKKNNDSPPKKQKRKIASLADDSDNESNDSNKNRRKKKKKPSMVDSDSDTASVDSERSSKRKRATIPPLAAKSAAVAAPSKTYSTAVAQVKAVSSITKNPNIQVKKVSANQSPAAPRKSTPQPMPQQYQSAEVATGSSSGVAEAAEIDCTPDLFAFLVNKAYEQNVGGAADQTAENSVTSSTSTPNVPAAVPANSITSDANPMVDVPGAANPRQFVRRVQRIQGQNDSAPVIHNYNG